MFKSCPVVAETQALGKANDDFESQAVTGARNWHWTAMGAHLKSQSLRARQIGQTTTGAVSTPQVGNKGEPGSAVQLPESPRHVEHLQEKIG